jgi:hypothetical protein
MSEWNGEGLPPVGTVCIRSYNTKCRQDERVEIVGYFKDQVAYGIEGMLISVYLGSVSFRPLKTER